MRLQFCAAVARTVPHSAYMIEHFAPPLAAIAELEYVGGDLALERADEGIERRPLQPGDWGALMDHADELLLMLRLPDLDTIQTPVSRLRMAVITTSYVPP